MFDNLTLQQFCALDYHRNMVVTAGPGAGKTRILSHRYCFILLTDDSISLPQILTLTFTEKAAEEMVHQHLLVLECSRHEDMTISEEDVDQAIEEFADERGLPLPMVRAEYGKEGRREELSHNLLEKKIFDFALPRVKITEVERPAESKDGKGK